MFLVCRGKWRASMKTWRTSLIQHLALTATSPRTPAKSPRSPHTEPSNSHRSLRTVLPRYAVFSPSLQLQSTKYLRFYQLNVVCSISFSNTSTSTLLTSCGSAPATFVPTPSSPSTLKEKTLHFPANPWPPSGMEIGKLWNSTVSLIIKTCF